MAAWRGLGITSPVGAIRPGNPVAVILEYASNVPLGSKDPVAHDVAVGNAALFIHEAVAEGSIPVYVGCCTTEVCICVPISDKITI